MPIIPEDSVMEDFVNWDNAESPMGSGNMAMPSGTNLDLQPVQDSADFDLALANIDGDDFSFWALEHFETSNFEPRQAQAQIIDEPASCDACQASGFTCKRVEEGQYKGYCTSCVALRHNCSFGLASPCEYTVPGPFSPNFWTLTCDSSAVFDETSQRYNPQSYPSEDLSNYAAGAQSDKDDSPRPPAMPKIGARFSRESVRILKTWLSTHSNRPYPSEEEREALQRQTGLNKTQITNWLANARRRSKGKYQPTRSTSPSVRGFSGAIEIPPRRGTPALEHMNPLQRWENSPPENEPASVTAIASAIFNESTSSIGSGHNSPSSLTLNYTDDDADKSCKGSSASSFGTSPSSASFASRFSHNSRSSFGSFGSIQQRGRRRRRRVAPKQGDEKIGLKTPLKTFQCTFCTETFRTKHDWQRHEKSLHLSLERWVCCPKGPRALNPNTSKVCCAFCNAPNPDNAHIEIHNYTSCQERLLDERTFYRKDHLRQHLRLVHDAKYLNWSMDSWKVATPEIRSRCGFCGKVLENWAIRVDHLAEHFKTGSDMKDWKGDWGFEPMVLSIVENAIPPWLINDERTTPLPFQASQRPAESPRSAYELIKLELAYYIQNILDIAGCNPSEDDMQHEACRIIYASEASSKGGLASRASWLRDLLMSSDQVKRRAQLSPIRGNAENCLGQLKINGKDNIFDDCPLEQQLVEFVKARTLLGLTVMDDELQVEACNILSRMEESSILPSEEVANFMLHLIYKDQTWLCSFRRRAGLPEPADSMASKDKNSISSIIYKYSKLEHELAEFMRNQRAMGVEPSDDDLRRHARCVVHKCQDSCGQTAADNLTWLNDFKQRHLQQQNSQTSPSSSNSPPTTLGSLISGVNATGETLSPLDPGLVISSDFTASTFIGSNTDSLMDVAVPQSSGAAAPRRTHLFLNGSGNYRQVVRELARYVASCMSPNNPAQHTPTDEEIRYQARWIMYDDGDPFNITVADNVEWLTRFKRSTGILPATGGPGLPDGVGIGVGLRMPWRSSSSGSSPGTGSASCNPELSQPPGSGSFRVSDFTTSGVPSTGTSSSTVPVNSGAVFSSRDFEDKLMQFAVAELAVSGRMPPDEALTARAKLISGIEAWQPETTEADDPALLGSFKTQVVDKVKAVLGGRDGNSLQDSTISSPLPASRKTPERGMDTIDPALFPEPPPAGMATAKKSSISPLPANVQVAISEQTLDEILRNI